MMKLFCRDFGEEGKPPLVLLHGLLGSSRNWMGAGRGLADAFHVMALDLRNHGNSPHSEEHNYEAMVKDVLGWMDERDINEIDLVGHSMGGKTAMRLACHHPDRIRALAVVDISPRAKEPNHVDEFRALRALSLDKISSRADADHALEESVPSWPMRQFLLTNLIRRTNGSFAWQVNLEGLARNLAETGRSPIDAGDRFSGPALWIVGGKSDFIQDGDEALIRNHFPEARIETFPESGHNPHVEDRPRFVATLKTFLESVREKDSTGFAPL